MLEITRQADYALRASIEVARLPEGERISTATIAARQKIPLPFLAKIISQLVVRGVLEATRGASGGVRLGRRADEINIREIIETIDGPIALNQCVRDPSVCELSVSCALCDIFTEAQQMLVTRLEGITLEELVHRTNELKATAA
jgi:Rrf2 family protein